VTSVTFDIGVNESVDPFSMNPKYKMGGSQGSSLELSDPMVQKRRRIGRFRVSAP